MGLSDGRKSFQIGLAVLIQNRSVTASQPRCHITLNAKASSLKSAQRRRKHCELAIVERSQNIFARCRPLPGGAGRPKFNQLQMVTTFTYKPSLVMIDARNFELSW